MFTDLNQVGPLVSTSRAGREQITVLERRLGDFYNTTNDYAAFNTPNEHPAWLKLVAEEIRRKFLRHGARIRVLEAGAGLGSAFDKVGGLERSMLHYTAQDISLRVKGRLDAVADSVHLGPLRTLDGQFDLIFSLFVLEHVASPEEFLTQVTRLLVPSGTHVVVCPRYDFPGYVCPSMRHLGPVQLFGVEARRLARNALTRCRAGRPSFWVNTDPSLFHQKWRRDTDAVHIVCQSDLVQWHRRRGYRARQLVPQSAGLLDLFIKRFATVCFAFDKSESH
jgi:SAM-dependent methyltransferase